MSSLDIEIKVLDSHVIGRSPGRQGPRSGPSPRAESNNMRIQHISISKLDSYYDRPTLITL